MTPDDDTPQKASLDDSAAEARAAAEAAKNEDGLAEKVVDAEPAAWPDAPEEEPSGKTDASGWLAEEGAMTPPKEDDTAVQTAPVPEPDPPAADAPAADPVATPVATPEEADTDTSKVEDAKAAAASAAADAKAKADEAREAAAARAAAAKDAAAAKVEDARSAVAAKAPSTGAATDRPEVLIGAAFVGAFLLAKLLKRLGR